MGGWGGVLARLPLACWCMVALPSVMSLLLLPGRCQLAQIAAPKGGGNDREHSQDGQRLQPGACMRGVSTHVAHVQDTLCALGSRWHAAGGFTHHPSRRSLHAHLPRPSGRPATLLPHCPSICMPVHPRPLSAPLLAKPCLHEVQPQPEQHVEAQNSSQAGVEAGSCQEACAIGGEPLHAGPGPPRVSDRPPWCVQGQRWRGGASWQPQQACRVKLQCR